MASVTTAPTPTPLAQRSEIVLSLAMLGVLLVLLAPLPPILIDLLIALNIGITLLVLLITLSATKPLDFSVFPSLLLVMTLFRLALNVATTRSILLKGEAGSIVYTFGNFVVGGDLIVGLVVFLILVIIQFVVITKGAGRVSEVAARFTLDALPGKQMAIDAELNAGAIDETAARRRREALMRETEFYGAMDGASKFVRGDAIAGVIITGVNLVGGITLGLMKSMPIMGAVQKYSILTVGDGLVSQIPALIIATASGMLVTKAASQTTLGQEIGAQVTSSARPLLLGAVIMAGLAFVPGLPKIPFFVLAILLFFAARRLESAKNKPAEVPPTEPTAPAKPTAEIPVHEFLQEDRIGVEIGARLIALVESKRGPGLLDRIGNLRRELARKSGVWVPPVRVRDNLQLEPEAYRILIGGRSVARGELRPNRWLAIDQGSGGRFVVDGEATKEPAFGMPARWIVENDRQRADLAGHIVVDAPSVLITHLSEIVRRHAHELLSRDDLKELIDRVRETSPAVIEDLIPAQLSMGTLHRILCLLLEERVPISNLTRILESLAHYAPQTKDPLELTDRVRIDLGRAICERFSDEQGKMHAVVFDPRLELELRRGMLDKNGVLDPARIEKIMVRLANEWRKAVVKGQEVALLTDVAIRRPVRQTLARALGDLAVVAYQEVPGGVLLDPVAMIKPEDLQ
jgi:flagellar biosynthesis protein FlhA